MLTEAFRVVLAAMLMAGCSDPAGVRQDGVEVQIDETGLTIHNGRSDSIYIFASEGKTATVILWAPCSDPPRCEGIGAGTTRQVDKERVAGWGQSNEVILWWWHLVPASEGGFRPDSVRAMRLRQGS
jgi:hypothetical protein